MRRVFGLFYLVVFIHYGVLIGVIEGKSYGKCELAVELATKYSLPMEEIPHWVCIAQYESTYDTTAVGYNAWDGSKDYGLFQINDRYWCSPPDDQNSCWMDCNDLIDDDIADDVQCARKIHRIHQRHQGNGFMAWVAWRTWCQGEDLTDFVSHCFTNTSGSQTDNRIDGLKKSKHDLPGTTNQENEETRSKNSSQALLEATALPSATETEATVAELHQPLPLIFVPLHGQVHLINSAFYSSQQQPHDEPIGHQAVAPAEPEHYLQAEESSFSSALQHQQNQHISHHKPQHYYPQAPQHIFFKMRPLSWYRSLFSKSTSTPGDDIAHNDMSDDLVMS